MKTRLSLFAILLILIAVISCKKYKLDGNAANEGYSAVPVLPEVPYNYTASGNDHLAALGRVLFYDKNLSLNNSIACASCHQQSKAFCDNLQFSVGLENGKTARNSPSIFAKAGKMFWDGRASDISNLVLKPVKNHVEMKFENLTALADKISNIDYYAPLFIKAFGTAAVDTIKIGEALSEFIHNFNFSNNKFGRSSMKQDVLTASEANGKEIFFGKGRCSNCHHIENPFSNLSDSVRTGYGFTDFDFNIGLDKVYSDNGRGAITGNPFDNGKFMVPVLLNVEFTAPYMHDGRFKTLEEVVEHYSTGVKNHPNLASELRQVSFHDMTGEQLQQFMAQFDLNHDGELDETELASNPPVKLNFTASEKRNLVDFLKTFSDPSILTDVKFKNPFTSR